MNNATEALEFYAKALQIALDKKDRNCALRYYNAIGAELRKIEVLIGEMPK